MKKGASYRAASLYALGLAAILAASARPAGAAYTFSNVADTAGPYSALGFASINNLGTVAFAATLDSGPRSVYRVAGGSFTEIASTTAGFSSFGTPSINDSGTVAFVGTTGTAEALYTGSGGTPLKLYSSTDGFTDFFGQVAINNSGVVAFSAQHKAAGAIAANVGVYTGQANAPFTTIIEDHFPDGQQVPYGVTVEGSLNNNGVVGLAAAPYSTGVLTVYTSSGGVLTPLIDNSGKHLIFSAPAVNASGTVALQTQGDVSTDYEIIKVSPAGVVTPVANSAGPYRAFNFPSINSSGSVAFQAARDSDSKLGIYTGPDIVADKVIAAGDPLFGSTVSSVAIGQQALNDLGQIALVASLADGRTVLTIATPVPEPASGVALGLGTLTLLSRRRRGN